MEALITLSYVYFLTYLVFIGWLIYGFSKVKSFSLTGKEPKTTFSIVVPFRNEAENLPALLESIRRLDYPTEMFEIILIDDFSEDQSASQIYKWRMENGKYHATLIETVRISGSPKKDAIARAIPIVANEWVITTDADCEFSKNWLRTLNDYILENNPSMIAGGVTYRGKNSLLNIFQRMDFSSLQGATIGSFGLRKAFMCNGANFAYTKKIFIELAGFEGNSKIASGDDVFLLQKAVEKFPHKVHYLKSVENIVTTKPVSGFTALFHQRVRWASKTVSYQSDFGEILALAVFLGNTCMIGFACLAAIGWFDWQYVLVLFVLKFTVDYILLLQANAFLNKRRFFFPLFSSLIYPFFSVTVALYSFTGKYEWKGRKFRSQ